MGKGKDYFQKTLESHEVQTEDGYLLNLLRIPEVKPSPVVCDISSSNSNPVISGDISIEVEDGENVAEEEEESKKNSPACGVQMGSGSLSRPPVLLIHGLLSEGRHWLLNDEDKALPYMLAAQGYDVWMGSYRGSRPSRNHVNLSTSSKKFWNFGPHEIGAYDIPSFIDYVLNATGHASLYYVGHSFGNTVLFIALSLKPEYNNKIKCVAALCPAVYGNHVQKFCIRMGGPLGTIVGKSKFLYRRQICGLSTSQSFNLICSPIRQKLVLGALRSSAGLLGYLAYENITKERLLAIAKSVPSPTSVKTMCHIMQGFKSGQFRAYDYGRTQNMKLYGQLTPPPYDFKNVKIPVATFTSSHDNLVPAQDVAQVARELPNLIGHFETAFPKMSHMEFVMGHEKSTIVYDQVVKIFNDTRNSPP